MQQPEWLKEGYYVKLSARADKIYKITAVEPFEFVTGDETNVSFTAVATGQSSDYKNLDILDPYEKPIPHLYQVLWGVKDGCRYFLNIYVGTNRLGIDKAANIGYVDNEKSPYHTPNPKYQFWMVKDFFPAINAKNVTLGTVTPKIWFSGMKYDLQEVTGSELSLAMDKAKPITMGGLKT